MFAQAIQPVLVNEEVLSPLSDFVGLLCSTLKDSSRRKNPCWELTSVRGSESSRSKRRNSPSQRSWPATGTSVGMPVKSTEQSTTWPVPKKMRWLRLS